jgi:phosphatidylethanolamine-binding protein (PEBP) family uncharacterized protein
VGLVVALLGLSTLATVHVQAAEDSENFLRQQALEEGSEQDVDNMEAFKNDGVVPDVADEVPPAQLQLKYGSIEVKPGMILTPTQVKDPPTVEWDADPNAFYTLIMNDPDAPSRKNPKAGEWHHWMVGNIPGADLSNGEVLSAYIGSGPPPNTGLHRYVFLLYKQASKQDFEGLPRLSNTSGERRNNQKARQTAKDFQLGKPIAGNFFQAEYDNYVPLLYKQLGM